MDILEKLKILSDAAKYDVSCVSSGSSRSNNKKGLGSTASSGICHSFTADGRCISLLKILMSNYCVYDCAYCVNRVSNDVQRTSFSPEEIADLTINFYRRNYIEGLFLSSGIIRTPDNTMELINSALRLLREKYGFNGYIHTKIIPGTDKRLIEEAGMLADRVSVNVELPSSKGLKLLAPQKSEKSIILPMNFLKERITDYNIERKKFKKIPSFVPAGQSTQLIVGATNDRDVKVLKLSESLYRKYGMRRVFYSAYVPVSNSPVLPVQKPPLLREHRLYQADWLLRFYGFSADELLNSSNPDFDKYIDPKCDWALRNLDKFPVEVNKASYRTLLRVPGIGVQSARKIIAARKFHSLDFDNLKKMNIVLKRAQFFITCKGKCRNGIKMEREFIRWNLIAEKGFEDKSGEAFVQPSLFGQKALEETVITV